MELGTLGAIRRYPVKSLAGEVLESGTIGIHGLEGDRERALVIASPDNPRCGKPHRGKENDYLHRCTNADEATALAALSGIDVTLERSEERFFDDAPISLIIDRWLDDLSAHVGYRVEYERFRPNFFITTTNGAPSEEELVGRELRLGDVTLRVRAPIGRCVVTTYHPDGGASDPRILRYIAEERSKRMGVYCDVVRGGIVRAGDRLTLVDRGH